jgi:tetratricopeptide (TPR) repeat protein
MSIRIHRAFMGALATVALAGLAACGGGPAARPSAAPVPDGPPELLLADADAALERDDYPQAARLYREAAQRSDDEAIAEQATRAAFEHHQLKEASLAARRWLEINPTSENAHRYAGLAALRLHRLDEAEQHFASLLDTAYISPAAGFLSLLGAVGDEGSPTDAMELFRRLSARHPDVAEGYFAHGTAALRADNFGVAQSAATLAVAKAPYWKPARMLQARTLIATGKEEEGLAILRDLVTESGSDISTHMEYAGLLAATGRDEEARAMLTPYVSGTSVVPSAVRTMGAIEIDAGNLDAAQAQFETLLGTGQMSYDALYFLGVIAEKRQQPELALRFYTRVAGGQYGAPAQQRVAVLKAQEAGLEAGLAHLDDVARADAAREPEVVLAKAALFASRGEEKAALQQLDAGLQKFPDSMDLRMSRVFLYDRTGREEAAIRELRELLAERPGDATVQNALGYTMADHHVKLDEARALITAALAQSPDNAAILDSMGWLLHREGRHAEALEYLERASRAGADPEIDLHKGEVQWAMGQQSVARETWKKALERWPENEPLRKRLERAGS